MYVCYETITVLTSVSVARVDSPLLNSFEDQLVSPPAPEAEKHGWRPGLPGHLGYAMPHERLESLSNEDETHEAADEERW